MKKFFSILTAFLIFAMCGFLSACGDKYSKMEYDISYAFTENSDEWLDGDNGIIVNYGGDKGGPLIQNQDGTYTLYIKVDIKNVKAKHLDDIIVTKVGTSSGIVFTSQIVSEGEVFTINITGNALSSLKFYETNSGKSKIISLNVYRNLDEIEVDNSINPAVVKGGSIALAGLNNITYKPVGLTNQTGVKFELMDSGYFAADTITNTYTETTNSVDATLSTGGVLRVNNSFSLSATNYVIRVKAVSVFNEEKFDYVYVYVTERLSNDALELKYKDSTQVVEDKVQLYTNSTKYSFTEISPDYSKLTGMYSSAVCTATGSTKYGISILVNGELYDASLGKDVNGVIIEEINGVYRITSTNSSNKDVQIDFVLEIDGFKYSSSSENANVKKSITIEKRQLAETISFNSEIANSFSFDIYSTNSVTYQGLELTVLAVPSEEGTNQIIQASGYDGVSIDGQGVTVQGTNYQIVSGSKIYINFTKTINSTVDIEFKILITPTTFNGKTVEADYKTITCSLKRLVTADKIEMLSSANGDVVSNMCIDSTKEEFIYVKVYFTGTSLNAQSVELFSDNENVKFKNGQTNITLDSIYAESVDSGTVGASQKYEIYKVALSRIAYAEKCRIRAEAGKGLVGVSSSIRLESVLVLDESRKFTLSTNTTNASKISDTQYSIAFNELIDFTITETGKTNSENAVVDIILSGISLTDYKGIVSTTEAFDKSYSTNAVRTTKLNKNAFSVLGYVGAKTQVVAIKISYYAKNADDVIEISTDDFYLELAIYNPISTINAECANNNLSYINSLYSEASTTTITFSAYARQGDPGESVNFSNESKSNASAIQVGVNNILDPSMVTIKYGEVVISDSVVAGNAYFEINEFNSVKLTVTINSNINVDKFNITFTALRFGAKSQVSNQVTINVVDAVRANGIELREYEDGNIFKEESNNSRYVYMSFMEVSENGYAEIQFLARAYYQTITSERKYDDLAFNIYAAQYDDNDKIIYEGGTPKFLLANARLEVTTQKITISGAEYVLFTVKANKSLGGGLFKFEIATKDSYSDTTLKYGKTTDFYIDLSDGSARNPYTISSVEEFNYINNDLTKHYVLIEDITIDSTENSYSPIGLVNTDGQQVIGQQFTGSLSGSMEHYTTDGTAIERRSSIKFIVKNATLAESTNNYFGLFFALADSALIQDLDLVAVIAESARPLSIKCVKPTYFGILAGKNAGLIKNVSLDIAGYIEIEGDSDKFYFGGLVGENNSEIRDFYIDNSLGLTIIALNTADVYLGLVSGTNSGSIEGNYSGKSDLSSLNHDIVANVTYNNYVDRNTIAYNIFIGAVAGYSTSVIENVLIGGKITTNDNLVANANRVSYLGGVVGASSGSDSKIDNCAVVGLDLTHNILGTSYVAGIVANASDTMISDVSYMSVYIKYYNIADTIKGKIVGTNVAGIVANASNVSLSNATVENLITDTTFYTLETTSVEGLVAGLIANAVGTSTISTSLVNANLLGATDGTYTSNIYTLANVNADYSYFVGQVDVDNGTKVPADKDMITNNLGTSSYSAVKLGDDIYLNGTKIILNSYLEPTEINDLYTLADISSVFEPVSDISTLFTSVDITNETFESNKYYYLDNDESYILAESFVEGATYYTFGAYDETYTSTTIYDSTKTYYTLNATKWSNLLADLYVIDSDNRNLVKASGDYDGTKTYYNISDIDITTLYILSVDGQYVKNTSSIINADTDYYSVKLKDTEYKAFIEGENLVSNTSAITWGLKNDTNTINVQDILYYFHYVMINGEPLMVIKPTDISVAVDNNVIEGIGVEISNKPSKPKISESVLINYHNNSENPLENSKYNTYTLLDEYVLNDNGEKKINNKGIVNLTVIPEDAQGGVMAEIYSGARYASIKDNKITFLGVSGSEAIIVRFYSIFNPNLEELVAFYTQLGITELLLESNSISKVEDDYLDFDYELRTYTGANRSLIAFSGENIYQDNSFDTIFDTDLDLIVEWSSTNESIKVQSTGTNSVSGVAVWCDDFTAEGQFIEAYITFELKLKYSALYGTEASNADNYITLASTMLRVVVYKSATNVDILTGDIEAMTGVNNVAIDIDLFTGYVNNSASDTGIMDCVSQGNTVTLNYKAYNDCDSVNIYIAPKASEDNVKIEQLKSNAGVTDIIDLFDFQANYSKKANVGYHYSVNFSLKDERAYRYITENINFVLTAYARYNADIKDTINVTFTPQELNTMRIENYTATSIHPESTYVNLFESNHTETSIISPGGIGGIMVIYLEPSYSNVKEAVITSSRLYVPSLGDEVSVIFEQVVRCPDGSYRTIYPANEPTTNGIKLTLASNEIADGKYTYDGIIYIHTQMDEFKGFNGNVTVTLTVKTENDIEKSINKSLITEYLPGATLTYDGIRFEDGYLVEKDSYNNILELKLYGYQFNSNPYLRLEWVLDNNTNYSYYKEIGKDLNGNTIYDTQFIKEESTGKEFNIGNYASAPLSKDVSVLTPNADGSYTLIVYLNVYADIPVPFKLTASLSLSTSDNVITSNDDAELIFYPTDYIISDVDANSLIDGELRVAINSTASTDLVWKTINTQRDYSTTINDALINYLQTLENADSTWQNEFMNLFTLNGYGLNVDQEIKHPEFTVSVIDNKIVIQGNASFNGTIDFSIHCGYEYDNETGITALKFGTPSKDTLSYIISTNFKLDISPMNSEDKPVGIYSIEDFLAMTDSSNYILMNDIVLEDFTPITANIASLDGNNRVIKIKSFAVDTNRTNYGLFDTISTYKDLNNNQHKTILKNVIVDYSEFSKLELTQNDIQNVVFGGLVANNNGGLIYNCDIVNMGTTSKVVNIIVDNSNAVNITFGGLVGINSGIITNSRVGTRTYTEIRADELGDHIKSPRTLQKLEFILGNSTLGVGQGFVAIAGGFVGTNSGTISSSYLANTSLISYSAAPDESMTAGLVADNSGTIAYSYVKADESTISATSPRATGNKIENCANGNVAGFVYKNNGEITNSYANTVVVSNSAYISGFVYQNNGDIDTSYSACTLNSNLSSNSAEQPFIGVNTADQLLSFGTLTNCYYYETDTDNYVVKTDASMPQAVGYNTENISSAEAMLGFVFVLSDSRNEREQGIWSYYNAQGRNTVLPELAPANKIAYSNRYAKTINEELVYINATSYAQGSANNPFIIRSVEEYNTILASKSSFAGYVRFVDNIDFAEEATSIKTRVNFTLGDKYGTNITSIEGNGMTIRGIYLDVANSTEDSIGLFSEIYNTYIKNLNLQFAAVGQFSSVSATYSGGLAGKMHDTVVINIDLEGNKTTIASSNLAGGLAGIITGDSLIHSVTSNLNVMAVKQSASAYMYYSEEDFNLQRGNGVLSYSSPYASYVKQLSYAGGIAGVIDIDSDSTRKNLSYITIDGKSMSGNTDVNIRADFAGGVAGYIGKDVNASRIKFNVGTDNRIRGQYSVGGLFAVSLGSIETSQVTAVEDTQYEYDTTFAKYIIALKNGKADATIDSTKAGNLSLLEGYQYAGGLVGIGISGSIINSYSKASFKNSATVVGGLVGMSIADAISYSYAVPYVEIGDYTDTVGGLIGSAYGVDGTVVDRNTDIAEYISVLTNIQGKSNNSVEIKFTFSTVLVDNDKLSDFSGKIDYISADYSEGGKNFLLSQSGSNALIYVFAGVAPYATSVTHSTESRANSVELSNLYDITAPEHYTDFNSVFSGWSTTYWSLNADKYFPLLLKENLENFIIIDSEDDLYQIEANRKGNFKIVKDLDMSLWTVTSNYIFNIDFEGTIIGEKEDKTTPILYNLYIDAKYSTGAGFFRSTKNATISNLIFSWGTSDKSTDPGYNGITINNSVEMVGMVSPQDEGSLFTNLTVGIDLKKAKTDPLNYANHNGVLVKTKSGSIEGFGGIVGSGTDTTIMACVVDAGIDVNISSIITTNDNKEVYIGGLIGKAIGTIDITNTKSYNCVIIGSSVSRGTRNSVSFKVTANGDTTIYYGGAVGYATYASIDNMSVGDVPNEDSSESKDIDLYLSLNNTKAYVYFGGLIGYSLQAQSNSLAVFSNMYLSGQEDSPNTQMHSVAGLIAGVVNEAPLTLNDSYAKVNMSLGYTKTNGTGGTNDYTLALTNLNVAGGIANIEGSITLNRCLFTGEINTLDGSVINNIYAGGIFASKNSGNVEINESMSNMDIFVGTTATNKIYAGGIVGKAGAGSLTISSSITSGRIEVISSNSASDYSTVAFYFGGMIGDASDCTELTIGYSISTTSILTHNMLANTMPAWNKGALFGKVPSSHTIDNVFYSTDLALAPEDSHLGTNRSTFDLLYGLSSWESFISDNADFVKANTSGGLPLIENLTNVMEMVGIISESGNPKGYVYKLGSSLNPIQVDNITFNQTDEFKYYFISSAANISNISGNLNGILIAGETTGDTKYTINNLSGILTSINTHSALSNLHINVTSNISSGIVGTNAGTIFNCSVQGANLSASGSGVGLIVNDNQGLVSHSYSSAEITNCLSNTFGGIVNSNNYLNSKINTCYFTGYVDNSNSKQSAAGIVNTNTNGYVYNSYMAGVIELIAEGKNSFVCTKGASLGSNNYIDALANVEEVNKGDSTADLRTIDTSELMAHTNLRGSWYSAVSTSAYGAKLDLNPNYINEDGTIKVEASANGNSYGYNYCYPVYNFGKSLSSGTEIKYQLYTGTGKGTGISASGTNDLKIPHLGVLNAVRSVASEGLNLLLIYDIDKTITWRAVGDNRFEDNGMIDGFNIVKSNEGTPVYETFNGTFVSNKNYTNSELIIDNACTVAGLTNQGLFANVDDATISYIKLGSFDGLTDSGPLGTNISTSTGITAYINNIQFLENATINGSGNLGGLFGTIAGTINVRDIKFDGNTISTTVNSSNVGALFGTINGSLTIQNLYTPNILAKAPSIIATNTDGYIGFIAGAMAGGSVTIGVNNNTRQSATSSEEKWLVRFGSSTYAGGLIGKMSAGSISGNSCEINIYKSSDNESYPSALGGIVGLIDSNISTDGIREIIVKPNAILSAGSFGGLVADCGATATFTNCTIETSGTTIIENGRSNFGLVVANLTGGTITANNFAVTGDTTLVYKVGEEESSTGAGVLVGYQNANLEVSFASGTNFNPTVKTNKTNLGGITGYYVSGSIKIGENYSVNIYGVSNVGGAFGYCAGNVVVENTAEGGGKVKSLIDKDSSLKFLSELYATIGLNNESQNGNEICSNFGGLFGVYAGGKIEIDVTDNLIIENKNNIAFDNDRTHPTTVKNVGGIAGSLGSDVKLLKGVTNTGNISVISDYNEIGNNGTIVYDKQSYAERYTPQLLNVGGIVGYTKNSEIADCVNSGKISGYQNVGGIVGYADSGKITHTGTFVETEDTTKLYYFLLNDDKYEYTTSKPRGTEDEPTYYTLNTVSNSGTITGILNVGGIVGVATNSSTIDQVWNSGSVIGNTSVGGIAGYSNSATICNTFVGSNNGSTLSTIKAVYYAINRGIPKISGVTQILQVETYIPTSVGGLIGSAVKSSLSSNMVYGVEVSSQEEGEPIRLFDAELINSPVISTVANDMAALSFSSGTANDDYINNETIYEFSTEFATDKKGSVDFNSLTSGFGGFIGSVDSSTIIDLASNNVLNANVNAYLGINVGTVYGYAYAPGSEVGEENTSINLKTPSIYGAITIDGAYNIGGVVGYIDVGNNGTMHAYSTSSLTGNDSSITLQDNLVGMYVGGIFGKLNANVTSNLTLDDGNVSIKINTTSSYYMGGLVGRLYMSGNGTFNGSIGSSQVTKEDITNENVSGNFGGLIGLLKVGSVSNGTTVTVKGSHQYAFTINTIENENYYDGESTFDTTEDNEDGGVYLSAIAYYINQDTFNIQGTSNPYFYDNDRSKYLDMEKKEIPLANPLNSKALGWHKDYTGFKAIRRCIPASKNKGAGWDSIEAIYDASRITYVATIASLDLSTTELPGSSTMWETTFDTVKNNDYFDKTSNADDNVTITLKDKDSNLTAEEEAKYNAAVDLYNSLPMLEKNGNKYIFNPNYICYTIYEENDDEPTLYSPMGIATLVQNAEDKGENLVYTNVKDNDPSAFEWVIGATITNEMPNGYYYIDANNSANGLQGLTYFTWGNGSNWTSYTTISGESKTYQDDDSSGKAISVFVENYLPKTLNGVTYEDKNEMTNSNGNATYGSGEEALTGAYFLFKTVYDNASANGLPVNNNDEYDNTSIYGIDDNNLPSSGSIFEVRGYSSSLLSTEKSNPGDKSGDAFKYWTIGVGIAIDVIITILTFGAGAIPAEGLKAMLKQGIKKAIKEGLKNIAKKGVFKLLKKSVKRVAFISVATLVVYNQVKINTIGNGEVKSTFLDSKDQNFGFISSSYTRQIKYTNGLVDVQSDSVLTDEEYGSYYYYSQVRPSDYYSQYYLGIDKDVFDSSYKNTNTDSNGIIDYFSKGEPTKITKIDDEDFICNGDETHVLMPKYLYRNGVYYISCYAGDFDYIQCQDLFDSSIFENYASSSGDSSIYYSNETYIYVHGYFDSTTNQYVLGSETDGDGYTISDCPTNDYIKHNGSEYTINGKSFPSTVPPTYTNKELEFALWNSSKEYSVNNKISGYNYIKGVIYTANGNDKFKDASGDTLFKTVRFDYCGVNKPSGTEGVDYVAREYLYTYQVDKVDADGKPIEDAEGNPIKEDKTESGTIYYTICKEDTNINEVSGLENVSTIYKTTIDPTDTSRHEPVAVNIYPYSFENPYETIKNNTFINSYLKDDNYYTLNNEDPGSEKPATITQTPTYYYYEGGYIKEGNKVYKEIPNMDMLDTEKTDYTVYNASGNQVAEVSYANLSNYISGKYYLDSSCTMKVSDYYETTIYDHAQLTLYSSIAKYNSGEGENISYTNIVNSWDTYKEYYLDEDTQLQDEYYVINEKLCNINNGYSINNEGFLSSIYSEMFKSNEEFNFNYNKYLTNSKHGLYTRYKYCVQSSATNPLISGYWKELKYVVNNKKGEYKYETSQYYLIPFTDNFNRNPNSKSTYLVESVKVTLSGNGSLTKVLIGIDNSTAKVGKITIK